MLTQLSSRARPRACILGALVSEYFFLGVRIGLSHPEPAPALDLPPAPLWPPARVPRPFPAPYFALPMNPKLLLAVAGAALFSIVGWLLLAPPGEGEGTDAAERRATGAPPPP